MSKYGPMKICSNCRYYVNRSCYRFPPNVIQDMDFIIRTVHPSPAPGDRCSEWAIHPKLEKHESN